MYWENRGQLTDLLQQVSSLPLLKLSRKNWKKFTTSRQDEMKWGADYHMLETAPPKMWHTKKPLFFYTNHDIPIIRFWSPLYTDVPTPEWCVLVPPTLRSLQFMSISSPWKKSKNLVFRFSSPPFKIANSKTQNKNASKSHHLIISHAGMAAVSLPAVLPVAATSTTGVRCCPELNC